MTSVTDSDGVDTATAAADAEALLASVFNNIALAGNNISLEMLQLATEVYGPDRADFLSHDPLVFENRQATTPARRYRSRHKRGAGTRSRRANSPGWWRKRTGPIH